ncbi:hypothetical protein A9Q99_03395 [Gammaproteobacteria bacterium 45_16_T64]|nr:hypothetical protein A9Q99_03395 [Gammaproteobacteria bacterium 45_16_T64]
MIPHTADKKVLIVDDDEMFRELLSGILDPHFDVCTSHSGDECIELLHQQTADLILLDIEMPSLTGFETCKHIRNLPENKHTPIVFISANNSLEEKLEAYHSGGTDFMTKPIVGGVLVSKIRAHLESRTREIDAANSAKDAMQTAMNAMREHAETGIILSFMNDSTSISDYDFLAKRLFQTCEQLGIVASINIVASSGVISIDHTGLQRPLEAALLEHAQHLGRIVDFGNRCIFNAEYISLLAKNMPIDDPVRYGQLKDSLARLIESADARVAAIQTATNLEAAYQNDIHSTLKSTVHSLLKIRQIVKSQESTALDSMDVTLAKMNESLASLALTENQEQQLYGIIQEGTDRLMQVYSQSSQIDEQFKGIIHSFDHLKPH